MSVKDCHIDCNKCARQCQKSARQVQGIPQLFHTGSFEIHYDAHNPDYKQCHQSSAAVCKPRQDQRVDQQNRRNDLLLFLLGIECARRKYTRKHDQIDNCIVRVIQRQRDIITGKDIVHLSLIILVVFLRHDQLLDHRKQQRIFHKYLHPADNAHQHKADLHALVNGRIVPLRLHDLISVKRDDPISGKHQKTFHSRNIPKPCRLWICRKNAGQCHKSKVYREWDKCPCRFILFLIKCHPKYQHYSRDRNYDQKKPHPVIGVQILQHTVFRMPRVSAIAVIVFLQPYSKRENAQRKNNRQ